MSSTPGDLPQTEANNAEDALGPDETEPELVSLLSSISAGLGGSGRPPADDPAAGDAATGTADLAAQVSAAECSHHAALQTTAGIRQLSLVEFLR